MVEMPPPRCPTISTIQVASRPPVNALPASPSMANADVPPSSMNREANRAAPADTPMSAGSARGFLNSPWMTAPEAATPAPTSIASSIRGRRISRTIVLALSLASPQARAMTSAGPMEEPPTISEKPAVTNSKEVSQSCFQTCDRDADRPSCSAGFMAGSHLKGVTAQVHAASSSPCKPAVLPLQPSPPAAVAHSVHQYDPRDALR